MGATRKAMRRNERNLVRKDQALVKEYCKTRNAAELAEYIVNKKTKEAIKELTRQQAVIEIREKAANDALWMMALNEKFRYKAALKGIYERVCELAEERINSRRGPNHVKDLVEAAEAEFGIKIDVPKDRLDKNPLLFGGKTIGYGAMTGTVNIMGTDVVIEATDEEVRKEVEHDL